MAESLLCYSYKDNKTSKEGSNHHVNLDNKPVKFKIN